MKKYLSILISLMFVTAMVSCSSDDESEKRVEYAQIVESRSCQDKLNDLYVGSDGDIESLARMLQVTPSSIERLRKNETEPTAQFDERLNEVAIYYFQNGQSFSKLQSVLDDEYSWYDSVLNFPSHHPWWFWGTNIVLLLILAFAALVAIWPILIEMLIFLVAWIASLCCSPDAIQDNYIDTINPTIEQIQ